MWLREWRTPGNVFNFSTFPKDELIIIAPTVADLRDIVVDEDLDINYDYCHEIRMSRPDIVDKSIRKMIGFSVESLKQEITEGSFNDFILSGMTLSQSIGELYIT